MPNRYRIIILSSVFAISLTGAAQAQELFVFKDGVGSQQMATDRSTCNTFAIQQTGFNPAAGQPAQSAPSSGGDRTVLRGAVRGAAVGAVVGEIGNDNAQDGAWAGAAGGAMIGGMRRRDRRRAAQAEQNRQVDDYNQRMANFRRAERTCLEAKGYTVN